MSSRDPGSPTATMSLTTMAEVGSDTHARVVVESLWVPFTLMPVSKMACAPQMTSLPSAFLAFAKYLKEPAVRVLAVQVALDGCLNR